MAGVGTSLAPSAVVSAAIVAATVAAAAVAAAAVAAAAKQIKSQWRGAFAGLPAETHQLCL